MREIKFQGKRLDNGEWVYGYYYNFLGEVSIIDVGFGLASEGGSMAFSLPDVIRVDPSTVGQFTGLYDSKRTEKYPNGQPIYEGDIVRRRGEVATYGVVWDPSDTGFYGRSAPYNGIPNASCQVVGLNNAGVSLEVIGNIHDNPELLTREVPTDA